MPLYALALEAIGDSINHAYRMHRKHGKPWRPRTKLEANPTRRPWVAQIVGLDDCHGLRRDFLRGNRDYREANGIGSRGIMVHYFLDDGLYEINELLTWVRERRYYLRIRDGQAEEIRLKEVVACLS